jgi:hypothetical protein
MDVSDYKIFFIQNDNMIRAFLVSYTDKNYYLFNFEKGFLKVQIEY